MYEDPAQHAEKKRLMNLLESERRGEGMMPWEVEIEPAQAGERADHGVGKAGKLVAGGARNSRTGRRDGRNYR